jgi:hypothetical protein
MDSVNHIQPLSAILTEVAGSPAERITVGELAARFGTQALGALIFVFGVACFLPFPPGATTLFGAPLLLLAPQLIFHSGTVWLPKKVRSRSIAVADLKAGLPRIIPWVRKFEFISKPRLVFLVGRTGQKLVGLVCFLLAVVLIFPIPFGNLLPSFAVVALAFSLIQRDGLIALVGYVAAAASGGVLYLAAHIIVRMFQAFFAFIGGA